MCVYFSSGGNRCQMEIEKSNKTYIQALVAQSNGYNPPFGHKRLLSDGQTNALAPKFVRTKTAAAAVSP